LGRILVNAIPARTAGSRLAHHVTHDRLELHTGCLEQLLETLHLARPFTDQLGPIPGQVPQAGDLAWRHETAVQQPALQQLHQPLGVLDIGLTSRQVLDVTRVDQQQLERRHLLKQIPHRTPIHAGRLHHHLSHPLGDKPVPQRDKPFVVRRVLPDLLTSTAVSSRCSHGGHHRLLMHVERGATLHDHVHDHLPSVVVDVPPLGTAG